MPEISRFFGIIVRMFFTEHNPPMSTQSTKAERPCSTLAGMSPSAIWDRELP